MDNRPSPIGAELIELMRTHGIQPSMRIAPASRVLLPDPYQRAWEKSHGGKPVLMSTVTALEKRGLLIVTERAIGRNMYRTWKLPC